MVLIGINKMHKETKTFYLLQKKNQKKKTIFLPKFRFVETHCKTNSIVLMNFLPLFEHKITTAPGSRMSFGFSRLIAIRINVIAY